MTNLTNLSEEVMTYTRMAICDMVRAYMVKSAPEDGAHLDQVYLTPMTCYSLYQLICSDDYFKRQEKDVLEFLKNGTNHPETCK